MSIRVGLVIAGLVLAGASVCAAGCGSAGDPGPRASGAGPVALPDLVTQLDAARYADYAGRPGVAVRDEAAFEEMRRYLVERYRGVDAAGSIILAGAVFDCLRQPPSAASPPSGASPPSTPGGCPEGRVPVRRVTLDDLVKFRTLADFLGKGPGSEGVPPESP